MKLARRDIIRPEKMSAIRAIRGEKRSGLIFLSGRYCNFRCRHCLTDSGEHRTKKAIPLTAVNVIRGLRPTLKTGNVEFVGVSGGEPMLHPYYAFAVATEVKRAFRGSKYKLPIITVLTNGTVFNEHVEKYLGPVKGDIKVMHSTDRFHKPPTQIENFRKCGFDVISRDEEFDIAGLGRAFDLDEDVPWKTNCDGADVTYRVDGKKILIGDRKIRTHKFKITEEGELHLCGYGGLTFGDLTADESPNVASELLKDEVSMEFLTRGPLGLAELYGKLKEAVEIFMEKGSCAVCHALSERII